MHIWLVKKVKLRNHNERICIMPRQFETQRSSSKVGSFRCVPSFLLNEILVYIQYPNRQWNASYLNYEFRTFSFSCHSTRAKFILDTQSKEGKTLVTTEDIWYPLHCVRSANPHSDLHWRHPIPTGDDGPMISEVSLCTLLERRTGTKLYTDIFDFHHWIFSQIMSKYPPAKFTIPQTDKELVCFPSKTAADN